MKPSRELRTTVSRREENERATRSTAAHADLSGEWNLINFVNFKGAVYARIFSVAIVGKACEDRKD